MTLRIDAIPAFADNYIWALIQGNNCVLVDPGDARGPLEFLQSHRLRLTGLLLTHHHADHIGGVEEILDAHPAPSWGPDDERMPGQSNIVRHGDRVQLPKLDLEFSVLETPGHTRSHIVFHGHGLLFPGDTLFSAGCGRLFEGTAEQMQLSLDRIMALPDDTRFYCAHEYTRDNCRFARQVEPDNPDLQARIEEVRTLRQAGQITLPDTLGRDRRINPFLRTRERTVIEAARRREPLPDERPETVFGVIRRWKDSFG